ncbi:hypothetical protein EZV62_017577 [Acer yangbiense]|uniref:F-box domain-containing protein n=1 Tax=Acer yangbiense TaxID=1000413 RepID=A0A5C7HH63_9ROSI|nr:hypothetical protein EZV62_017577 [Acer yangbiense]
MEDCFEVSLQLPLLACALENSVFGRPSLAQVPSIPSLLHLFCCDYVDINMYMEDQEAEVEVIVAAASVGPIYSYILPGKDVVIAAETGCGKTNSYLIPLIDMLRGGAVDGSENTRMAHNWDELPRDILMEIAKLLPRFEDYAPFSGVCTSWQSAAACLYPIPLLMLAPRKDSHVLDFYHLSDRIVNQVSLSEALTGKRCYSSKGCLITIGHDLNVNLMHPFSNLQHNFPNIKTIDKWDENYNISYYDRFIFKCVLSSNPLLESDYILVVMLGGFNQLVYARPGDETWTFISKRINYSDITYYRGQLYAVNRVGQIMACSIGGGVNHSEPEVVAELPSNLVLNKPSRLYIVESAGALLIISRDDGMEFYINIEKGGGKDMGIYSLQDGSITPHFGDKSLDPTNPPTWIEHGFI